MSTRLLQELDRVGSGVSFLLSFSGFSSPLAKRLPQLVSNGDFWRTLRQTDLGRTEPFFHLRDKDGKWGLCFEGGMGSLSKYYRYQEVDWDCFQMELQRFLVNGPSFYNRRCPEERARKLLREFSETFEAKNEPVLVTTPGILTRVSQFDRVGIPYFDGRGRDKLYLWGAGCQTWALLLNGKECRNRRVAKLLELWENSEPLLIVDSKQGRPLSDYVNGPAFMEDLRMNELAQDYDRFHVPEYANQIYHLPGTARSERPLVVLEELPWSEFPAQLLSLAKEQGLEKSTESVFKVAAKEFCSRLVPDDGRLLRLDPSLLYTETEADERGTQDRLGYYQGSSAERCWSWVADGRNWILFLNELSWN